MTLPSQGDPQNRRQRNQRRIAFEIIGQLEPLLRPGVPFLRELGQLFRAHGRFGSRDRRLYRELVFAYLRFKPWLDPQRCDPKVFMDWLVTLANPTDETVALLATLEHPPPLQATLEQRSRLIKMPLARSRELLPTWFLAKLPDGGDPLGIARILSRAPIGIRIQRGAMSQILLSLQADPALGLPNLKPHDRIPDAIVAEPNLPVEHSRCYLDGQIEIQDSSSQALLHLLDPSPSGHWLDACAGAGGKTLQLARMLALSGKVDAYDPRQSALEQLAKRAAKTEFENIAVLKSPPARRRYDGVLVDAPCSGSGTWRRHPFLMRQTTEKDVERYSQRQLRILADYKDRVRPGGRLIYCTCSLCQTENDLVVERFLTENKDFSPEVLSQRFGKLERGLGVTIWPSDFDGDGLFVASMRRT